jgi:SAM-dependent methyltransferase
LHGILVDEAVQPFRFLDIACGDASATVNALRGTQIAHYHGIDLSQVALDLAATALAALACPVILERRDYVEALRDRPEPADVAWIGYSLHHLLTPAKLALMREIRSVVRDRGLLLICEPASPDGEDRSAWLRCYELLNQPLWKALTSEEWDAMIAHVRVADFPETTSRWHSLGTEAGFSEVREVFVAPDDLHRHVLFPSIGCSCIAAEIREHRESREPRLDGPHLAQPTPSAEDRFLEHLRLLGDVSNRR